MDIDKMCDSLGFCGCGFPREALFFVRDGLHFIKHRNDDMPEKHDPTWFDSVYQPREMSVFGSEGSAMFFYYWADKMKFTDHGNSVPGWMTKRGERTLWILENLLEEDD